MTKHRDLMLDMAAVLTAKGYRVARDNEGGGAMVLENDERTRVVFGLSVYEGMEPWQPVASFIRPEPTPQPEPEGRLVPALPEGGGKESVGWVLERSDSSEWWTGDTWGASLSDAMIYEPGSLVDDKAKAESLPTEQVEQAEFVKVYAHEVDGCLTSEPCPGVNVCQDCLDVRESVGEVVHDPLQTPVQIPALLAEFGDGPAGETGPEISDEQAFSDRIALAAQKSEEDVLGPIDIPAMAAQATATTTEAQEAQ